MGLDMFLYSKNNYGELQEKIYWRKANHIHGYFERVKDPNKRLESCEKIEIDEKVLIKLLETCYEVRKNKELAEKLLPRVEGFFFGSMEYDNSYYEDIDYTIEMIEVLLVNREAHENIYVYDTWY